MVVRVCVVLAIFSLTGLSQALADWSVAASGNLFYTDDVALFSATRRSGLDSDPSQPVLDSTRTGLGSDMVFEPGLLISNAVTTGLGRTAFSIKPQGFIFAVNPEWSQASVAVEALHAFNPSTALRLRYFAAPDQLLGRSEVSHTEPDLLARERVTSHVGYIRLEQRLSENWEIRLQGRVGKRLYNESFARRNTTFWTIGPHVYWRVREHVRIFAGYHYERGLASGRHEFEAEEDASYVHHFFAAGFDAEIMPHVELEMDFHYERNNWTSGLLHDERNGEHENIFQGTGRLLYHLTDHMDLTLYVQRANRRVNVAQTVNHNTNVGVGVIHRF